MSVADPALHELHDQVQIRGVLESAQEICKPKTETLRHCIAFVVCLAMRSKVTETTPKIQIANLCTEKTEVDTFSRTENMKEKLKFPLAPRGFHSILVAEVVLPDLLQGINFFGPVTSNQVHHSKRTFSQDFQTREVLRVTPHGDLRCKVVIQKTAKKHIEAMDFGHGSLIDHILSSARHFQLSAQDN